MSKPKVCVLMSTYNGEKYLEEQIESILSQEGVLIELVIRDDGSTDSTKDIIKKYEKENYNVECFFGENVGVGNSFMDALYSVGDEFDYYAFSDQDDIWQKEKIQCAISMLKDSGKLLYASNQECIDANGESLGLRYKANDNIHVSSIAVFQQNMLAGCTFVFDVTLKKILCQEAHRPSYELLNQRIHDVWVINVAALNDGIVYDETSHMKYRQHEDNLIGAYSGGLWADFTRKISKLKAPEERNGRSKLGNELWMRFEICKSEEVLEACHYANTISGKLVLIKNCDKLRIHTGETRIGLILKIIFNLF